MLTASGHNYRTLNNFSASFYNNHGGNEDITRQLVTSSPACFFSPKCGNEQELTAKR